MKKLILGLCLLAGIVHADTVATSTNKAGGLLVLTDISCKEGGFYAYASANGASTLFGCWWSDQTMVHILWKDGDVRSYPLQNWDVNNAVAEKLQNSKGKGI